MQVHVSSVFTLFVALLCASGTTGCRNTGGGPWYNPTSYSFVNPFDKENKASKPHYASEPAVRSNQSQTALPSTKVSPPPGGFTDGGSTLASRADVPGGIVSATPPEHWSVQNHVAAQNSPGFYDGYTNPANPEPSQYAPQQYQQVYGGGNIPPSHVLPGANQQYPAQQYPPQNQYPNQYPGVIQPAGNTMPYNNVTPYEAGQSFDSGAQYGYQQGVSNVPGDTFAVSQPSAYNTGTAAVPAQNYNVQQPVPSSGYGYEQSLPSYYPTNPNPTNPSGGGGVAVASPYTPSPTPASVYQ